MKTVPFALARRITPMNGGVNEIGDEVHITVKASQTPLQWGVSKRAATCRIQLRLFVGVPGGGEGFAWAASTASRFLRASA